VPHTCLVGLLWTRDRPVAETSDQTQHSQETDIHDPGTIRTRNPSKRADTNLRLRRRGQRDRLRRNIYSFFYHIWAIRSAQRMFLTLPFSNNSPIVAHHVTYFISCTSHSSPKNKVHCKTTGRGDFSWFLVWRFEFPRNLVFSPQLTLIMLYTSFQNGEYGIFRHYNIYWIHPRYLVIIIPLCAYW
jgi:hypothetical protein